MVKLAVNLKATLENVTDLVPDEGFVWWFKLKCGSCNEVHPNLVGLDPAEKNPIQGSRGEANLVWKCTLCKREHSANFDTSVKIKPYTNEDSQLQKSVSIAVFECRGCEFVEFDAKKSAWKCKGTESDTLFQEISLEDDEWVEYDEKANEPVSIFQIETSVTRA